MAGTHGSRQQEQVRTHVLNHKQEAERVNLKWLKAFKLQGPPPTLNDVCLPVSPYLLGLPNNPAS